MLNPLSVKHILPGKFNSFPTIKNVPQTAEHLSSAKLPSALGNFPQLCETSSFAGLLNGLQPCLFPSVKDIPQTAEHAAFLFAFVGAIGNNTPGQAADGQ